MSYDLSFYKTELEDFDEIQNQLEALESQQNLSEEDKQQVIVACKKINDSLECFENSVNGRSTFELTEKESGMQISIFNSAIYITVPYWDSNSGNAFKTELLKYITTFIEMGYTCVDSQIPTVIKKPEDAKKLFNTGIAQDVINKLNSLLKSH